MTTVLRTERVALRELTEADLDVVAALMADEEQMSLYPRPRTRDESHDWLSRNLRLYEEHGFGFWLMEAIEDGAFLGYCGIRPRVIEGREETEMGWHTHKRFWTRGLATEAAAATQALAFARFGTSRVVAVIDPVNEPSHRVAQKIGMTAERKIVLDDWPCILYSSTRPALAAFATVLDDEKRVLLVRRRDLDIWECPGGAAEAEETPKEAVIREVREETGLSVSAAEIAGLYWRPNKKTLVVQFLCSMDGDSTHPTDEAVQIGYFPVDHLPDRLAPVVRQRIEDSLANRGIFTTQTGPGAREFIASLG